MNFVARWRGHTGVRGVRRWMLRLDVHKGTRQVKQTTHLSSGDITHSQASTFRDDIASKACLAQNNHRPTRNKARDPLIGMHESRSCSWFSGKKHRGAQMIQADDALSCVLAAPRLSQTPASPNSTKSLAEDEAFVQFKLQEIASLVSLLAHDCPHQERVHRTVTLILAGRRHRARKPHHHQHEKGRARHPWRPSTDARNRDHMTEISRTRDIGQRAAAPLHRDANS